jgi:hypothetical protein
MRGMLVSGKKQGSKKVLGLNIVPPSKSFERLETY